MTDYSTMSDPDRNPQFRRRWTEPPQCEGFQSIGEVAAEIVADMKFRHQVLRLHRLGPRVTAELLAEIGAERSIQTVIDKKLDTYAGIEPETLEATGGDRFWPAPLHEARRTP